MKNHRLYPMGMKKPGAVRLPGFPFAGQTTLAEVQEALYRIERAGALRFMPQALR